MAKPLYEKKKNSFANAIADVARCCIRRKAKDSGIALIAAMATTALATEAMIA